MMRNPWSWAFGLALICAASVNLAADAASVSATLSVTVQPALSVAFVPTSATIACNLAPGTVVATLSASGGDGNPVSLAISGDITDFSLSGANSVVVGPAGIAPSNCGKVQTVTGTATQQ